MAKREWQQGIILSSHPDSNGNFRYILISKKTGFQDVWIGGRHYYYNSMQEGDLSNVDVNQLAQDALPQQTKKSIVIVRRQK